MLVSAHDRDIYTAHLDILYRYLDISTHIYAESITEIVGGPDIHVDHHATLKLTCRVYSGDKTPAYIIWQREDKVRG